MSGTSQTIRIAFYKGGRDIFVHRIIKWWTKSSYSHAELVLEDGETCVCLSPSFNGKVSIKQFDHTGDWDFVDFKINAAALRKLKDFISETEGDRYDWSGMLLSHLTPFLVRTPNKWYCSQWIAHALFHGGIMPWRLLGLYSVPDLSPQHLFLMITNESRINKISYGEQVEE
jgi:hypothetical protein